MNQTEQEKLNQQIEELTLLMLYLTSWTEKVQGFPEGIPRSWKGYPFESLNKLVAEDYLVDVKHPSRTKSAVLTEEGIAPKQKSWKGNI